MLILRSTEHLFAYQDPLQYFEVCGACMQPQVFELSNWRLCPIMYFSANWKREIVTEHVHVLYFNIQPPPSLNQLI